MVCAARGASAGFAIIRQGHAVEQQRPEPWARLEGHLRAIGLIAPGVQCGIDAFPVVVPTSAWCRRTALRSVRVAVGRGVVHTGAVPLTLPCGNHVLGVRGTRAVDGCRHLPHCVVPRAVGNGLEAPISVVDFGAARAVLAAAVGLEWNLVPQIILGSGSFFEFSLCLSRACLGKKIAFIYKWRENNCLRIPWPCTRGPCADDSPRT
jgi:hypothetical protein